MSEIRTGRGENVAEIDPEDAKATLRVLRALHDLSQADLAARAGLDVKSVQRYEQGRPIPAAILTQLGQAAGVPEQALLTLLLPTIRYFRTLSAPGWDSGAGLAERQLVELGAARAAEAAAMATRGAFLRAWADHVREALEHDANAWRPKANDREVALDLWQRMEPLTPGEWEVFLRHGTDFHSWALAEKVADLALEAASTNPSQALERADLAVRIANLVPGSEAWKARVRGYAFAALGRVLRETGEHEVEQVAAGQAERLWAAGMAEPGLLSEERFRAAMGAAKPN
jgi:transcriptional regulator with XRE-family HTH domain